MFSQILFFMMQSGGQKQQEGNTRSIEEEFERLYVHRGNETKISPTTTISKTISNKQEKKDSVANGGVSSHESDSPTRMPPLENLSPDLDDSMPELEPLGSPEKPYIVSHGNKGSYRNGYDDMPDLQPIEPIEPLSPARSNVSSIHSTDTVQLFISNFPYGTKEVRNVFSFLTISQTSFFFYLSAVQVFGKHSGKRRNCS